MKTLILLALTCLLGEGMAYAQTPLYVAPGGSASNPGTSINAPTTLANALATVPAGGTIYLRGGTYSFSASVIIPATNNGTSSANKNVVAYASEVPVLDFSGQAIADANRGLVLDGDYWHFTSITIRGAGDNGMLLAGNNNIIEKCIFSGNHDSGLQLSRYVTTNTTISSWPSNNLVLNCEAFDNQDPDNEDADGFAAKLTCGTGNVFRGCISHHNIDDGWDFYAKDDTGPIGAVTLENCVAYNNGALSNGGTSGNGDKNGFKLGGSGISVNHIVRRCVAFNNGHHGFTDNNNPGNIEVSNNTSYNNAESNFNFREGSTATYRNNLSFNAGSSDKSNGTEVGSSNVWWKNNVSTNSGGLVVSSADFVSTSPSVGKNSDGSPNLGNFLALANGSDMINTGVTAPGITYTGSAPDLGARESGSTSNPDPGTYTLSVTASPAAGGTVTASPNASSYTAGTVVTLTATPTSGYTFSGWSGAASGTSTITTVTVNSNLAVTASFTANNGGGGNTLRIDDAASASSGYCGADGSRQNSYSGADGGYYINLSNSAAKGVNYRITVPSAGTYSFVWRYASGGANVSTIARLLVNGSTAVSSVSFPKTSSWTAWTTTAAVTATLAAGANTVRIETTSSTEFAIIDWLEVTGNTPSAGACTSSLSTVAYKGEETYTAVNEAARVYPNPTESTSNISFYNKQETRVAVRLFDANGALVNTVTNKVYPAGQHQLTVDCSKLVKAVYFISVERNGKRETLRIIKQ
jgi:uncharacterized repeat protein (TIGR02543 family)